MVVANCPALTPLPDPSMGATTLKLFDMARQYRQCQAAALQGRGHE